MKNETLIKLGIAALGAALMGVSLMEPAHFPPVLVAWAPLVQKVCAAVGGVLEGWVLARRPGDIPPMPRRAASTVGSAMGLVLLVTLAGGCVHDTPVAKLRAGCEAAGQLVQAAPIATQYVCPMTEDAEQCLDRSTVGLEAAGAAGDLVCRAYRIAESREQTGEE